MTEMKKGMMERKGRLNKGIWFANGVCAVYIVLIMAGKYGKCRWSRSEWYCSRQMGNLVWGEGGRCR